MRGGKRDFSWTGFVWIFGLVCLLALINENIPPAIFVIEILLGLGLAVVIGYLMGEEDLCKELDAREAIK